MTEPILTFVLILLWCTVLFGLHLTITTARRVNAIFAMYEQRPELPVGAPAPDFEAETLMGEKVTLTTYLGRAAVFVFMHPHCSACRQEVPTLEVLGPLAKKNFDVDFVIVMESTPADAHRMVKELNIQLPVLIAPRKKNDFGKDYNPGGINPYYCYIDKQGNVRARDPLGKGDWPNLQRRWAAVDEARKSAMSFQRYT